MDERCTDMNDVLVAFCPLDYSRHECEPSTDLGMLDKLPMEIKEDILEQIDLESLLVFRRVNKKAMAVVDGMAKWKKVC